MMDRVKLEGDETGDARYATADEDGADGVEVTGSDELVDEVRSAQRLSK